MISAEKLKTLISLEHRDLADLLSKNGYSVASFKNSRFVGLTNGGELCYRVTFYDESGSGEETGKVFISYNSGQDRVLARY